MIQNQSAVPNGQSPLAGPILCFGFLTATLMFCAWYLTHFPGVSLPPWAVGVILLIVLWVGMTAAGIVVGAGRAWKVGLGAGLLCSLLDLLVLGSYLVEPADGSTPAPGISGLALENLIYVPGFLAVGGGVGLVAAWLAGRIERTVRGEGVTVEERVAQLESRDPSFWLGRLAIVAVATLLPLLLIGGSVTSTQSGMAIRGWPDSDGANMFLYPINLMTGRVFFEHSHRLFGALTGLTTMALMAYALVSGAGRKVKGWSVALFILVCIQGWIGGGGRVNLDNPYFGALHGIAAQVIFAIAVALAAFLSPNYREGAPFRHDAADRRRKAMSTALLHTTLLQLALGAMYRHLKATDNPGSLHILYTHAAFALIVVVVALFTGLLLRSRQTGGTEPDPIGPALRRIGKGILVSVSLQFLLGWLAFWFVAMGAEPIAPPKADELATAPPIDTPQATITTLHQANGAVLLALATLSLVWSRRIWRDRSGAKPESAAAR
jgi:hypothetical protein